MTEEEAAKVKQVWYLHLVVQSQLFTTFQAFQSQITHDTANLSAITRWNDT